MRIIIIVLLILALIWLAGCATVYEECASHPEGSESYRECAREVREYNRVEAVMKFQRECAGQTLFCDNPPSQSALERYPHRYCRCDGNYVIR